MSVIKEETIKRLLKDVKQILKNPLVDNGIYYIHDEDDFLKGYAMIVGPEDTPYFGGFYFFKLDYPVDYPFSPPKVKYMTNDGYTRFNPNLYVCGKVCVSILNTWVGDKWSSCQTINSILLTLCSLLNSSPLENEPGQSKSSHDFIPYQKTIEYKNIDFAICNIINPKNNLIPKPFEMFFPVMKEQFMINYSKIMEFIVNQHKDEIVYRVSLYNMLVNVDYKALETKMLETKTILESSQLYIL
jgi:ubiquitin-protein ligase